MDLLEHIDLTWVDVGEGHARHDPTGSRLDQLSIFCWNKSRVPIFASFLRLYLGKHLQGLLTHLMIVDIKLFVENLVREWNAVLSLGVDFVQQVLFNFLVRWLIGIVALALQQVFVKLLVTLVHVIRRMQILVLFNHAYLLTWQSQIELVCVLILKLFKVLEALLVVFGLLLCALIDITVSLGDDLRINTLAIISVELSIFVWRMVTSIIRRNPTSELPNLEIIQLILEAFD